jgi:hypothetical protein
MEAAKPQGKQCRKRASAKALAYHYHATGVLILVESKHPCCNETSMIWGEELNQLSKSNRPWAYSTSSILNLRRAVGMIWWDQRKETGNKHSLAAKTGEGGAKSAHNPGSLSMPPSKQLLARGAQCNWASRWHAERETHLAEA